METILAYLSNAFVAGAIGLVAGVVFSQKIKDYITGAPAGFRVAMNGVEAKAKADVAAATADIFAKFAPKPVVTATVNPAPAPAPAPTPAAQ